MIHTIYFVVSYIIQLFAKAIFGQTNIKPILNFEDLFFTIYIIIDPGIDKGRLAAGRINLK